MGTVGEGQPYWSANTPIGILEQDKAMRFMELFAKEVMTRSNWLTAGSRHLPPDEAGSEKSGPP